MNRFVTVLLCCSLSLGCHVWADEPDQLTVAVAASVMPTFKELQAAFTEETGIEVTGIFGSSGKMTAQVKAGAPFDLFLSADTDYPKILQAEDYAAAEPKVYAYGKLVLWTLEDIDLGKGVPLLVEGAVKKVAIPNPKVAPYGREAVRALEHYKIYSAVEPKLVYGESIAQAMQFVESRSTDIGFTAKSIVLAPELKGKGQWVEVSKDAYQPIAQAAVILKHGQATHPQAARRFFDFLSGEKARAIFSRYGYELP